VEDWKSQHKAICGRPLTLEDVQATSVSVLPADDRTRRIHRALNIGPPSGGFIRSPAFKYQMHRLNTIEQDHIVCILHSGSLDNLIGFPDECMRRVFHSYCVKAMTSGDIEAFAVTAEEGGQLFWLDPSRCFKTGKRG